MRLVCLVSLLLFVFACKNEKSTGVDPKIFKTIDSLVIANPDSAMQLLEANKDTLNPLYHYYLGRAYLDKKKYAEAGSAFQQVLLITSDTDTLSLLSQYNIAVVRFYERSFEEAFSLSNALLAKKQTDLSLQIKITMLLATISDERSDTNSFIYFNNKSLDIAEKLKDTNRLAMIYNNIGMHYVDTENQPDSALLYIEKSLEMCRDSAKMLPKIITKSGALRLLNRLSEAEALLNYVANHWPSQADSLDLAWVYLNLSYIYVHQNNTELVNKYAEKAAHLFHRWELLGEEKQAFLTVLISHFMIEDTSNRKTFEQFLTISSQIDHKNAADIKKRSEDQIQLFKVANEAELIKIRLVKAELHKKLLWLQSFVLLIVALVVIFIAYRSFQRYKLWLAEKELENKLLLKDIEKIKISEKEALEKLLVIGEGMIENKDIFDQILQELNIAKKTGSINTKEIELSIKNRSQKIDDREVFIYYLQKIQEGFMQNLKVKYPSLTETELKVSGLLSLNLSSKKIATLLHVEPKSVEVYRYRLRKKFELAPDDNLTDFLKYN